MLEISQTQEPRVSTRGGMIVSKWFWQENLLRSKDLKLTFKQNFCQYIPEISL